MVFFDAGETILHPHPSFPELFAEVCGRRGHDVDADDVSRVQQKLAPHLVELAEGSGVTEPSLSTEDSLVFWSHLYRRLLQEFGVRDESLVAEMYAVFSSTSSYRLFEDALPALTRLSEAGYRLGLISNFEAWLEEMLVELEVGHLFDVSIISGLEGVEKPDPKIYRRAIEVAGVRADRVVHVGDSPAMDVEPARSVGINAVLLDRWDRYRESEARRIRSLAELPDLVHSL
ncbi:MAG: HAD-IA family hydrolase [Actinobacteria bacterium]|nr:HAD-IA family hydrolase [Actinomycetota bacterium]